MTWTIPNTLTVLRLLAAPGVAVMFLYFHRPWADWFALTLFVGAAITDYFDGYLARLWKQESKFGTMLDPIADKAMVVIALLIITGYSGMNPWLILPATAILFREVFVSGLREYLGGKTPHLKVSQLAKWKTTAQMVAIAVLFLGTGLEHLEGIARQGMTPDEYADGGLGRAGRSDPVLRRARLFLLCHAGRPCADLDRGRADADHRMGILPQVAALPAGRPMIDVLYFAWVRERIGLPRERVETRRRPWPIWWPSCPRGKSAMPPPFPTSPPSAWRWTRNCRVSMPPSPECARSRSFPR